MDITCDGLHHGEPVACSYQTEVRLLFAMLAAIALLACAACGSAAAGGPVLSPPPPSGTVSSCEATVLGLLGQSAADLENGDQGGLEPVQVMDQYGLQSPVYRAFVQLDGAVLTAEEENGNTGLLTPFVSQAAQLCKQYGG